MESSISTTPNYRDEHKIEVSFPHIFMAAYIETQSLNKTVFKPTAWKRHILTFFPGI